MPWTRNWDRARSGIVLLVLLLGTTGVSQQSRPASGSRNNLDQDGALHRQAGVQLAPPPAGTYFDHAIVIIMENQGIQSICHQNPPPCLTSGPSGSTPFIANLANNYTIGSHYLSLIPTSQPNYIALISGSLQGCTLSGCPTTSAPNLVDRFETAGLTWKGYFENQTIIRGCDAGGSNEEPYTGIHNPFISFQDITNNTARCNRLVRVNPNNCGAVTDCVLINDLNNATLPAPNFMWLSPSDCDNMRSSSVCTNGCITEPSATCLTDGDNYLKSLVPNILNSTTFKTTRSALFLTFDEGDGYCPINNTPTDCVPAIWAGPVAKTASGSSNLYNHYSFTKTIETNWNLAGFTVNDTNASPMSDFFKPASPDFSISNTPPSLSFNPGSQGTTTINLSSMNSFAGTVALSTSVSSTGLTASLNHTSVTLSSGGSGSSTLTVSSTIIGTYSVNVTGTSGGLSHWTVVTVNVGALPDFSISGIPASFWMQSGSSPTSTIQLTSLNSFNGTVSLSAKTVPAGLKANLSSSSLNLSAGGSATSNLTFSSTAPANYTVTITATNGSLLHMTTILVTGVSSMVSSDSDLGPSSAFPPGGTRLIQDSTGRMIAVYIDSTGKIGLSYDNSDPMLATWSTPTKSATPASPYTTPAAILLSLNSLRIIAGGGSVAGAITDIPVTIARGGGNNITGFSFGTSATLDSTGAGKYPSAVLAHNGDILLAWAWQNTTQSLVKSLRWDPSTGWKNLAGSSASPDLVMVSNGTYFVPALIERPDNFNVYLLANRNPGPPSNIAYNKATWNGSSWSWGSADLTYETNASDADDDPVSLAWDPVRSLVVAAYGITGSKTYGVFTLSSTDVRVHNDTPTLAVGGDRGWASVAVNATRGDYYIFFVSVDTDAGSGPLGYIRLPFGGSWNATINWLDSAADNEALSVGPTGTSTTVDVLYAEGTFTPVKLKFIRLGAFRPPRLLAGDVNLDCRVNIFDLSLVAVSYGARLGDPRYNPNADLNGDGIINITDLTIVGSNFGKTC
jgi:hypothetical protein